MIIPASAFTKLVPSAFLTRAEEMKYNRVLNENITKLAEVNALMAGKLSVYEPIRRLNLSPMRRLKNNQGNSLATRKIHF